jgi:hypothetical protein
LRGTRLGIAAVVALLALPATAVADTLDVNTNLDNGEGTCVEAMPGGCTLREAIGDAVAGDTVNVPLGDYVLVNGELSVFVPMTITGAGARQTVISGGGNSKVLYIASGGTVTVTGVTLTGGNGVGEINNTGGAVYVSSGTVLNLGSSAITNSNVTGNGGGIYSGGRLVMVASTVSGNTATANGGGIYHAASEDFAAVALSTISGNGADAGGGIYASGAPLIVADATIAGNSARAGGGVFKPAGVATFDSAIVTATSGGACGGQLQINGTHNLTGDLTCPFTSVTNTANADPLLGPLQDNGGQTNTRALAAGSPAIGAANPDPAQCTGADQRGIARPQQGTCDIGAFEYVPPTQPPPPSPPEEGQELPPPVAGRNVNALPKSGTVRIRRRGQKKFVKLTEGQQIPVGSTIDTLKGRVTLVVAADNMGKTATSDFYGGIFKVLQTKGAKPITELLLTEKLSCPKSGQASIAAKKRKRRLWGDGKGKFRTEGEFSSATVRGTKWLVQDSCGSTLTRVVRGKVAVRDFVKKKTVIVRKGKRYIARAKG